MSLEHLKIKEIPVLVERNSIQKDAYHQNFEKYLNIFSWSLKSTCLIIDIFWISPKNPWYQSQEESPPYFKIFQLAIVSIYLTFHRLC